MPQELYICLLANQVGTNRRKDDACVYGSIKTQHAPQQQHSCHTHENHNSSPAHQFSYCIHRLKRSRTSSYSPGPQPGTVTTASGKDDAVDVSHRQEKQLSTNIYIYIYMSPVAAARAAVATGTWVESKHDMYLIHTWKCGSSSFIFTHPPEDEKRKKRKAYLVPSAVHARTQHTIQIRGTGVCPVRKNSL